MFNIQVIEAKDVPSMDRNGLSDPFIKLYLLGTKTKEKIGEVKTKIIKKSLTPVWNEEYHFPIKSLGTDVLHLSVKDWNKFPILELGIALIHNQKVIKYGYL